MPPCAADRFDEMSVRLFTVWDRRFETAPNFERWMLTVFIALSSAEIAAMALEGLLRIGPDDELELLLDEEEELEELLDGEDVPVSNIWAKIP